MTDYSGQQLGSYRLLRPLGRGGFAEVYLGEHVRLGMKAAVKILHTNLIGEEIEAFQREAQVIANLGHPHIVRVLDFDVQQGTPFLVLDYAPNGSLREKHPRGRPLPLELVVQYTQQVGSALQYAHDNKLIHRDVKPENMLVGKQGEILLSDFGIAAVAHSTSSMSTQSSMGTLTYMAPEQIQGKPRRESDQYALAVTVYQWLSGEAPFQGSTSEIIAQHLAATPPPLRSKAPHVPAMVEQVVMTALTKNPQERFGSVQAFVTALEQACGMMDQGRRSGIAINAPTIQPSIPSTLAATVSGSATSPALTPQPASPAETIAPVNNPVPEQLARTPQAGNISLPPYPPLPYASAVSPQRKKNPWLTWLVVTLVITVVGAIASLVIPAMMVYRPHSSMSLATYNGSNQIHVIGNPGDRNWDSNVPGCQVGTSYNVHTGKLQGASTSFSAGTKLYFVCHVSLNYSGVQEQLVTGSDSEFLDSGQIDSVHHIFYDSTTLQNAGVYTWGASIDDFSTNTPDAWVTFQINLF